MSDNTEPGFTVQIRGIRSYDSKTLPGLVDLQKNNPDKEIMLKWGIPEPDWRIPKQDLAEAEALLAELSEE